MSNEIPNFRKQNAQKYNKNRKFDKVYKAAANESKPRGKLPVVSKLPSNWDAYDNVIDDSETLESLEIDFEGISLTPSSGNQFQLKQDRAFLPEPDAKLHHPDIFELDMNLISLSLSTIPFYKRMCIDETYLTEGEIEEMNKNAVEAKVSYDSYMAKTKNRSSIEKIQEDSLKIESQEVSTENRQGNVEQHPETAELEAWLDGII